MARVTDEHIEARKSQILDAAWTCFARNGYHRTTMQHIATEAGISAGAIYRYFDGKEAVLVAINQRSQELARTIVAAAGDASDPIRAISVIGAAMLRLFRDPEFDTNTRINIEVWPEVLRHEELRKGLADEMRFWRAAVTGLLADAKSRGDLKPEVDPGALGVIFMCAWEGMRHYRTLDDGFGPEAFVALFRSLLTEQGASRWVFEDLLSDTPLGIPHSMPPGRAPSMSTAARAPKKRAKE